MSNIWEKNLGYKLMKSKMKEIWHVGGDFDIMDVEYSLFIVKFDLENYKNQSYGRWSLVGP